MRDTLLTIVMAAGVAILGIAAVAAQAPSRDAPSFVLESLGGRDSFNLYCASCHGVDGTGGGPVAPVLTTPPPDLSTLARRNAGAFPRERVLGVLRGAGTPAAAHGTSEMPLWLPIFRGLDPSEPRVRVRLDNIVSHVESLQQPSSGSEAPGARLFRNHCASCHGDQGRGNGPMAEQLRRRPVDLTSYTARNGGVFPDERLRRIVDGRDVASHGDPVMPVWGDVFSRSREGLTDDAVRARISAIVDYLRSIQQRAAE